MMPDSELHLHLLKKMHFILWVGEKKLIDNMYVKKHIPSDEPQVGGF